MMKTTERLNLILALNKCSLDVELLAEFPADGLLELCTNLSDRQTPEHWYRGQSAIQKELCNNEQFFFYLERAYEIEAIKSSSFNGYLQIIHDNGNHAMDYPVDRLISSIAVSEETNSSLEVFHDYLVFFSNQFPDKRQAEIISTNLALYRHLPKKAKAKMSKAELLLFYEEALNSRSLMLSPDDIDSAFDLLSKQKELLDIIRFLHANNLTVSLTLEHLETFSKNPVEVLEKLNVLHNLFGEENMLTLMELWTENHCPYHELEVLHKRLYGKTEKELSAMELDDMLETRSSYINFIYGNRIKGIPLSEINQRKEGVLIYAITNKKNGFIKLVEENYEAFTNLWWDSVLFHHDFYSKFVNINSLNAKNLNDCARMKPSNVKFEALDAGKTYTFEEIKALYDLPIQYYQLYTKLDIPGVDARLTVLRQLSKNKLLANVENEEHIAGLAAVLTQKPLSAWREQDFSHIIGLKAMEAVNLLIHWERIQHLVPQMATRTDAFLVARNHETALTFDTLDDMKGGLVEADGTWKKLVEQMGFSDEFLSQNQGRVVEFLCQNGAEIAHTYFTNVSGNHRDALKLIVKAELMGEFGKLKYYADDLRKELDYPITDMQKSVWMANTDTSNNDEIDVKECDDFFNTMLLGTVPQRTCLSYADGQYKECLLSSFDSNKKVLFAHRNGIPVGRAIVRLTKGRFEKPDESQEASFSFVDVEAVDESADSAVVNAAEVKRMKERLIIFLERSYSASVSSDTSKCIDDIYVELMAKKARDMGAMLVISNSYGSISNKDFVKAEFHVYISKSKAGTQYLDSLNGSAKVSDEGGYRSNNFYIHKDAVA